MGSSWSNFYNFLLFFYLIFFLSSPRSQLKGAGRGFARWVSTIFCTKLVKNVFCTKLVNDDEIFFGTMGVNGIVFLHDGVLKKWGCGGFGWLLFLCGFLCGFSMLKFLLWSARIKTMHLKSSVIFDWRCRIIQYCWKSSELLHFWCSKIIRKKS